VIVPLDKPAGPTSSACVRRLGLASGQRAGHAGTLDPGATGLLVVCLGEYRKLAGLLATHDKRYHATLRLGTATDTLDAWGEVVEEKDVPILDEDSVSRVASRFTGRIRQAVPAFSAVKRGGVPLHRLARRGQPLDLPEREVTISAIQVVRIEGRDVLIDVICGAGTYIRSLARDIAGALGTVGHVASLRRTACGSILVEGAPTLDEAVALARSGDLARHAVPCTLALRGLELLGADEQAVRTLRSGRPVPLDGLTVISKGSAPLIVLDGRGEAVCVAGLEGASVRPRRVLL